MDIRQSENYAEYMRSLGWKIAKAGSANVFIRHFPIFSRWSVIKVQRFTKIDFEELDEIAKKHHALFVKIEPHDNIENVVLKFGFRKDSWPLLPAKTLVLDLVNYSFDNLSKDTRYEIRQAEKHNLFVNESTDIELFYTLLRETMKIGKWEVPIKKEVVNIWKSFQQDKSALLLCYHDRMPVAGCLLIWEGNTAHYLYAANTKEGRKFGAAYLTLWEAIKFCQKKGVKYLDLEGIYDERYAKNTKNWQGFTKFKMGWGGREIVYPGSFVKYYNILSRILFSLAG